MLQIHYFASLREQLNCDNEQLAWQENFSTIDDIKEHLSNNNTTWKNILAKQTVLVAINQQIAEASSAIKDGDEIAFFPPVTGG
ncbi:MAG: molybdopterin converting factor subunit 1 [Cellvibrionaceae bacterium]